MHAGIDEAGRGPVLGPLVVAGVATADPARLAAMGCKDSKRLTPAKRSHLARLLYADPEVHVAVRSIEPETLDEERRVQGLNAIEALRFRDIAAELVGRGARSVLADAADVDAARFADLVRGDLPADVVVEARHKAEESDACVAAASIIAKVTRDAAIAALARRLERKVDRLMGSGYPGDATTQAFLTAWWSRFHDLPPGTRRSWSTAKAFTAPRQAPLDRFGDGKA